jgi:ribonuclease-3
MSDNIKELQSIIKYNFKNELLLKLALTHKSYSSENGILYCNERMEFLGDSILSAIVSNYLYNKYQDKEEGVLSQTKAQLVSAANLAAWAKEIKLDKFILVSKNEEKNGAKKRDSLLCDSFEAVTGAVFLDAGFKTAEKFINTFLKTHQQLTNTDYKTKLQEKIQSDFQTLPKYIVIKESGPDHNKKFEIAVYVKDKFFGKGKGSSKKQAEQAAAHSALLKIKKNEKYGGLNELFFK